MTLSPIFKESSFSRSALVVHDDLGDLAEDKVLLYRVGGAHLQLCHRINLLLRLLQLARRQIALSRAHLLLSDRSAECGLSDHIYVRRRGNYREHHDDHDCIRDSRLYAHRSDEHVAILRQVSSIKNGDEHLPKY